VGWFVTIIPSIIHQQRLTMAVKVLVNAIGQHIVSDAKQVEEKETKKIIAYLLTRPRVASYSRDDEGNVNVSFSPYCVLSDDAEFTIRAENIVSILDPREDVATQYTELTKPAEEDEAEEAVAEVVEEAPKKARKTKKAAAVS
jgi:hypothetical protein